MDVKETLDSKDIKYKFSTRDYIIRCLSPDHEDNNPSCHVDKLTGIYHCWSCGDSGNIFTHFGISIPNLVNLKVDKLQKKILKLMWSKPLEIPLVVIKHEWDFRGISAKTLQHFEAFTTDDASLNMEGRIIFPFRDIDGNISLFLGRHMYSDLEPKYKIFPVHVEVPLYPEVPIIRDGSIILVEGIFDLLNLWDKGLKNVILCGGVNIGLVKKQVKQKRNIERLLSYKYQGVHTLYLLFDGDKVGRAAAEGLKKYAGETFNIKILDLKDGQDPGNLNQEEVNKINEKLYGKINSNN